MRASYPCLEGLLICEARKITTRSLHWQYKHNATGEPLIKLAIDKKAIYDILLTLDIFHFSEMVGKGFPLKGLREFAGSMARAGSFCFRVTRSYDEGIKVGEHSYNEIGPFA